VDAEADGEEEYTCTNALELLDVRVEDTEEDELGEGVVPEEVTGVVDVGILAVAIGGRTLTTSDAEREATGMVAAGRVFGGWAATGEGNDWVSALSELTAPGVSTASNWGSTWGRRFKW
jgi:hypothetical protein